MTLVLNVLHKDFSLLVADNKAVAEGEVTVKLGNMTINCNAKKGVTINGFQKIYLNQSKKLAIGIAGSVSSHEYLSGLNKEPEIQPCLNIIHDYVGNNLRIDSKLLDGTRQMYMDNQGFASFFDSKQSAFITKIYSFSEIRNYTILHRCTTQKPLLLSIGSGSGEKFDNAVGKTEIGTFLSSVSSVSDLYSNMDWLQTAFEKVSEVDSGVGKEFKGMISTRQEPEFQDFKAPL